MATNAVGLTNTPKYIKVAVLSAAQVIGRFAALIESLAQATQVMAAAAITAVLANTVVINWVNWSF